MTYSNDILESKRETKQTNKQKTSRKRLTLTIIDYITNRLSTQRILLLRDKTK